jgi:predicted dinucleotide-binding enzyme
VCRRADGSVEWLIRIWRRLTPKAAAERGHTRASPGGVHLDGAIGGQIVILAVPYEAVPTVIGHAVMAYGRVVVDISNPVDWSTLDRLATPPDTSTAAQTALLVPAGTPVVRAFNTTFVRCHSAVSTGECVRLLLEETHQASPRVFSSRASRVV